MPGGPQPPREAVRVGEGSKSSRNLNSFRQRGKLVAASLICCAPKGGLMRLILMRLMSCDDDRIAIRRSQIGVTRVTGTSGGVVPTVIGTRSCQLRLTGAG